MAKYNKKRARELQHDKFRDTAGKIFDGIADKLEGRGNEILYVLGGLVVVALLLGVWLKWSNRKADEARRALGRGITIATAPLATASPLPGEPAPAYSTEKERAQKAVEEFQKVVAKYGDPYQSEARYLMATNMLYIDRDKATVELAEVSKSSVPEVAALAKFALAQAYESASKPDDAAKLYSELAALNSTVITPEIANLHLAEVYEKQGKRKEAVELFFNIAEAARKTKGADGEAIPPGAAAREATEKLQKLDPDRYAKLTPETPDTSSPF